VTGASFSTEIEIDAAPEVVFDHFVRPELLVRWMGDFARLEGNDGGVFSVDINGVLIRGHFVQLRKPGLIEIAWGEAGNAAMPPGATRLVITIEPRGPFSTLRLAHSGLTPEEATKHAIGWPHFLERLAVAARGDDPGVDPWKDEPPTVGG
jgi:uncharacterized protein YndB with AHSA1/START domain